MKRIKPKVTGETLVTDTRGRSHLLRPAEVRSTYEHGRETIRVKAVKRADNAWIVRTRDGRPVGVVETDGYLWGYLEFQKVDGRGNGVLKFHVWGSDRDLARTLASV